MDSIKDSFQQVDQNTWLVGDLILRRSAGISASAAWYDQALDASYTVIKSPLPLPEATPLPAGDSTIKLVKTSVNSAVWAIGTAAFCKIKQQPEGTTLEAKTLAYVRKKKPGFAVPFVLYAAESGGRSYLFQSTAGGRTLGEAWPTLNDKWKRRYVDTVASICKELSEWTRERIGGVDGKGIPERYLTQGGADDPSPENVLKGCQSCRDGLLEVRLLPWGSQPKEYHRRDRSFHRQSGDH